MRPMNAARVTHIGALLTICALMVILAASIRHHASNCERLNRIVNDPFLATRFSKVTLSMDSNLKLLEDDMRLLANLKPSEGFGCYRSDDACPTAS